MGVIVGVRDAVLVGVSTAVSVAVAVFVAGAVSVGVRVSGTLVAVIVAERAIPVSRTSAVCV